jgi:hypothetical protein
MSDQPGGESSNGNAGTLVRTVVTVVLLLGFGVLVTILMVTSASLSEVAWNRRVYLLGGVEAIVFTSVGWLFGREVHRSEAQTAKNDAAQAKQDAAQANQEALEKTEEAAIERTKGQAVKAAARHAAAPGGRDADGGSQAVGLEPGQPAAAPVPLAGLVGMVEELWPD